MDDTQRNKEYALQRKTDFEGTLLFPIVWHAKADSLRRAAEIIHQHHRDAWLRICNRGEQQSQMDPNSDEYARLMAEDVEDILEWRLIEVYFLLMGYSIENLLKGIVLSKQPGLLDKDKGKLSNTILTHNLVKLAKNCDINITLDERHLLEALTTSIVWEGKYPTPKEEDSMYPFVNKTGNLVFRGQGLKEDGLREQLSSLWNKLSFELMILETARRAGD